MCRSSVFTAYLKSCSSGVKPLTLARHKTSRSEGVSGARHLMAQDSYRDSWFSISSLGQVITILRCQLNVGQLHMNTRQYKDQMLLYLKATWEKLFLKTFTSKMMKVFFVFIYLIFIYFLQNKKYIWNKKLTSLQGFEEKKEKAIEQTDYSTCFLYMYKTSLYI